jgi:aquaporin Z
VIRALREHWPEYLMEAALLGLFMLSASFFSVLFEHPASPVRGWIADPDARRACVGVAMGLTAIALVYSPWGKQSGAHMNPAVTLTFWRLGKVRAADAVWYGIFQFLGGIGAMLAVKAALHPLAGHPSVNYAATAPGPWGVAAAFWAEAAISGGLMLMVLFMTSDPSRAGKTGLCAGVLVALYITFEAPFSGMSMNPARTVASALPAGSWTAVWIYFLAPAAGMLLAVELFRRLRGLARISCAKLHHGNRKRCIFCGKAAF